MKNIKSILTIVGGSLVLAACGGSGGDNDNDAPENATIRGVINETLPSSALPSSVLPSVALPSTSLPSVEVAPLDDAVEVINVTLERTQEVGVEPFANPDANQDLTATGNISVNTATGAVTATVTATGLDTDDAITAVHIHDGFAGNNGGVLLGLTETALDSGIFTVTDTLTAEQIADFLAGGLYFNLHTTSNPAGQLRGQIFNAETDVVRTELQSQQEVLNDSLPEVRDTSAVAYFTYSVDAPVSGPDTVIVNLQANGFTPFLAADPEPVSGTEGPGPVHVHAAPAGQNGRILFALRESEVTGVAGDSDGVFWTTLNNDPGVTIENPVFANRTGFLNGNYYLNVHSEANPGGEVRGQIIPQNLNIERVEIQTAQEIPAVATPAADNVGGVGYIVTREGALGTEFVGAQVQVQGFVPSLPAAASPIHIHRGFAGATGGIDLFLSDITTVPTPPAGVPADTFFSTAAATAVGITAGAGFDATAFDRGENYINVHSDANPTGEIRAQITPAASQVVRAELQAEQEPQGSDTTANPDAAGIAYVTIDQANPADPTVVVNTTVTGFDAALPANPSLGPVHLHRGFAGLNGGIAVGALQGITETPADSNIFLSATPVAVSAFNGSVAEDVDNLLAGGFYINVHSAENPGGELRGQITPEGIEATRSELQASQEPQGSDTTANPDAAGVAFVTIDQRNTLDPSVRINARVSGFTPFLAADPTNAGPGPFHLHRGFAGVNGNIAVGGVQGLNLTVENAGTADEFTQFSSDAILVSNFAASVAEDAENLLAGGLYFNVHSEANPAGELRGQLVPSNSRVLRAELDGSQVLPAADDTSATGIGYLTITDFANGQFLSNVTIQGLDDAEVTVNIGGNNNNVFVELTEGEDNSFSSPVGPVANLNGILNGAYSFEATGESEE